MRKHELLVAIAGSLAAGIGAFVLSTLPFKWAIAVIVGLLMIAIMLIVRGAQRVLLFALAFFIPVFVGAGLPPILQIPGYVGLSNTLDIQFVDILILALIIYRLVRWATQRVEIRLFPYTTVPAIAWLVVSALSALNAREAQASVIQLGQMAELILLYLVVANSIEDGVDVKWLVTGLLLGVLSQGLLGSYQWITGHPLGLTFLGEPPQLLVGDRTYGTIGSPNGYAMFLAATLPAALAALFLDIRGFYKVLASIVLCTGFLGLIFSLSRGAWLGFGVASTIMLVFVVLRRRQDLWMAIIGAGSILLILLALTLSQRDLITARLTSRQATESAQSRVTLNQGAIGMIRDYPILGVGLNNYSIWMPQYDPTDYVHQGKIVIVHNIYLLIAAETGIVGLLVFLWFLWTLLVQSWRLIRSAQNDTMWLGGVAAFSAFTALAVHGMVDYGLLASAPLIRVLWLFAAIVAGLSVNLVPERNVITHSLMPEIDNA